MSNTFIVTGIKRSGTSALMNALIKGMSTIEASYTRDSDAYYRELVLPNGYNPNPLGYFECPTMTFNNTYWSRDLEGTLYKCDTKCIPTLSATPNSVNYIMWMRRDAEELSQSWIKMGWVFNDDVVNESNHAEAIARLRSDCRVIPVPYYDLVNNPKSIADKLRQTGIPIDNTPGFVAAIDKTLYRHRKTRGIFEWLRRI